MGQNDTQLRMDGNVAKHPAKLGNKNALKHGLHTKDAHKRWSDMESTIKEVRTTLRKLADANPDLHLNLDTATEITTNTTA